MDISAPLKRAFLGVTSSNDVKREIGNRLIDQILVRTNAGIDKEGSRFVGYSKAYKKSLAFKVYGKTNKVNLKLTGAMQSAIAVVGMDSTSVTIGFTDEDQQEKARGHIEGTGANDALPIRDFWGLPLKNVQKVMKDVIRDFEVSEERFIEIIEEIPESEEVRFTPSALSVEEDEE